MSAMQSHDERKGTWVYTLLGFLVMFVVLILVALAISAGLYWFVILPGRLESFSSERFNKWLSVGIYTPVIFWWAIRKSKSHWRKRVFWIAVGALLAIHAVCCWLAFRYVERWIPFYVFVAVTLEGTSLLTILRWTMRRFGHTRIPSYE